MGSIVLSGPDGSGKTTLARYLRSYLHSKGIYTSYTWYRGSHLAASLLARMLSKTRTMRGHENPYYSIKIPEKLKPLWLLIEFTSILPHYLARKALSISGIAIGDRGILDFIVWIYINIDHTVLRGFLKNIGTFAEARRDLDIFAARDPRKEDLMRKAY